MLFGDNIYGSVCSFRLLLFFVCLSIRDREMGIP